MNRNITVLTKVHAELTFEKLIRSMVLCSTDGTIFGAWYGAIRDLPLSVRQQPLRIKTTRNPTLIERGQL